MRGEKTMIDKYISAEAFKFKMRVEMTEEKATWPTDVSFHKFLDDIYSLIARGVDEMAAADVVEVVRCKDCRHSDDTPGGRFCKYGVCVECKVEDDFFCRGGERKEKDK